MKDNFSVLFYAKRYILCIKFQRKKSEKSTEELSLMTLKSDVKFKENLTCGFKYNMRNLVNFDPTTQSLKISLQWALFIQSI